MNNIEQIKGLPVRAPWIDLILVTKKVWEIRGQNSHNRNRIALIRSGSKTIVGLARIKIVLGPLTKNDLLKNYSKHRIPLSSIRANGLPYKNTYAWVLTDVVKINSPIPYEHPNGAITWVGLSKSICRKLSLLQ